MEPGTTPPSKAPYKNGVDHNGRGRGNFAPRSWSFQWRAKVEGLVALGVIAGVVGVFVYLVQIPGALVIRVVDDGRHVIPKTEVRCHHPSSGLDMVGETDIFGEAKFPGLARGRWTCDVQPPARFFSPLLKASGEVRPRQPDVVELSAPRAVDVDVSIARPEGAPRAAVSVRAVCPAEAGLPPLGWESRAGVLEGAAILYLPHDRKCRVALMHGDLGPLYFATDRMELDCDRMPCSDVVSGKPGAHLAIKLKPTREQWEAARPPPEPEMAADAGTLK